VFEPTTDQYGHRIWTPNDPVVRTADGVQILQGLRVFTNDLDRGVIDLTGELGDGDRYRRPANYEWHGPENRWVLWFDVVTEVNYKGEPTNGERCMQSHDRVATRFEGRDA